MKVLIAAGGSGGHIFPAIALAKKLKDRSPGAEVMFVGSSKALDRRIFEKESFRFFLLSANRLPYKMTLALAIFYALLLYDLLLSFVIILFNRPDVVVAFGGYVGWPVVVAGYLCGVPRIIHEQNAVPGRANKSLFAFVDRIAVSFEETKNAVKKYPDKVVFTGNPIRDDSFADDREGSIKRFGLDPDKFTVLVIGGSQGAHLLNESFLKALSAFDLDARSSLQVIHITGIKDYDFAVKEYDKIEIENRVYSFIDKIEDAYSASDLVVTRSGASAMFEIAFFGRPMILVPYPFAMIHQAENAEVFSKHGAAVVIKEDELNSSLLEEKLLYLIRSDEARDSLGRSARRISVPAAAGNLAEEVLNLAKRR